MIHLISAELKRNISQKAQDFILDYLDSAVVGKDNAVPLFTALVKTDATATGNRYGSWFT